MISTTFPGIDRDVAITGALLHDIGKLDAYTSRPAGDRPDRPRQAARRDRARLLPDPPRDRGRSRTSRTSSRPRCCTSSSATTASSSTARRSCPCTREATLVHMIDNLGGKLGSFDRLEKELPARLGLVGVRPRARRRRLLRRAPSGVNGDNRDDVVGRLERARARALARGARRRSAGARGRGDGGRARGAELGGVVARRRRHRVRARASAPSRSTATAATPRARRGWRCGWRSTSSTSAPRGRSRAAGSSAPSGCWRASSRARARLARLPRGLHRPRERRHRARRRARPQRGRARAPARRARPRDARARARGRRRWSRARASTRACAGSTRRPRRRSRAAPRTRCRAPGPSASSSPPAPRCSTTARAAQWCDRIAEFAERYGSRMMLGYCRAEYGAVDLWRGRWADAEAMLEAAIEDFMRSRPGMVGGPLAGLAELRRRQGRPGEAARAVRAGGGVVERPAVPGADGARPRRRAEAAELVERLLRQRARAPPAVARAGARAARARARRERRPRRAARALAVAARGRAAGGDAPLRACADVAEGVLAAARGDHDRARVLLEDAVDAFTRSGAPFEAAQARLALAAEPRRARARRGGRAGGRRGARAPARARRAAAAPPLPELTPREREVLALLAEGLDEPRDRRAAGRERAHRAPPRHEHPAQARPPLAHRRRRGRGRGVGPVARSGYLRAPQDGRCGRRRGRAAAAVRVGRHGDRRQTHVGAR